MSEKNGVEIDYCPECRGIWLDRGELDKIMDRARGVRDSYDEEFHTHRSDDRHDQKYREHRESAYDYDKKGRRKKSPASALSDILEIFGGE